MTRVGEFDIYADGVDIEVTEDDLPELRRIRGAVHEMLNPKDPNEEIKAKERELKRERLLAIANRERIEKEKIEQKRLRILDNYKVVVDDIIEHRCRKDELQFRVLSNETGSKTWVEDEYILKEHKDLANKYMNLLLISSKRKFDFFVRKYWAFRKIFTMLPSTKARLKAAAA